MIKIAICDDEKQQRSILTDVISTHLQLNAVEYKLYEFDCGEALCASSRTNTYDIIFLDIEMKHLDGIETAKSIRMFDKKAVIIFVTAYPDFVFQGYEVRAFQYILKPYKIKKIIYVLQSALEELIDLQDQYYAIEQKSGTYKLNLNDTLYFFSDKRNIHAVTLTDSKVFYGKIDELTQELPDFFIRIHQRYLINIHYVTATCDNTATIKNEKLPISRVHKQSFMIAFAKTMLR